VQIVASDVTLPNGLAVSADGSTLVASDTGAGRVVAYDIADDGKLENARTFADLDGHGHPDGLCLDAEGAAWVGCYDAEAFVRVLEGGQITHRIPTGGGWAVAPALGGPDRRTLHLVINDTTIERLAENDSDGRIETVRVDVPGAGWP
jgi:sugar lactone lactonase YvrE